MTLLKQFEAWFNLKFGWAFVNGRKQSDWLKSLEVNSQQQNTAKRKTPLQDNPKERFSIAE
ncbi:hypothetical protein N9E11_02865 [Crocinitomicaceae bacterium]|nr:hypothetical protein [Crocinitomicaceae bacterium]